MAEQQPDILFLMPDQHRGDCLGIAGHPVLLTPNLDALGRGGAYCSAAYTTCPSCIPARRALLSGRFPVNNGMPGFVGGVPLEGPTLPGCLRDGGYQTVLVGRTMHQHPNSCRYGYEEIIAGSTHQPDLYSEELEREAPRAGGIRGAGMTFNGWPARPWHLDEALHPTTWVANRANDFLRRADETCPLFLTVSFYAPHPPLVPPAFYFDRYLRQRLPEPSIGEWVKEPEEGWPPQVDSPRVRLTGEGLRSAQAGYFGLINHIDDQLYWLISAFRSRAASRGRDSVIVFSTDHGEMLGDHCYFRKCEPYEGSAHIPMLFGGSLVKPRTRIDEPVCLEDLFPTLMDFAGLDHPDGLDGVSLAGRLRGESSAPVREMLHSEHAPCYSQEQAYHMLTDGRWKYIWRPITGREELFDLQTDPGERRNLADHDADLTPWRDRMIAQLDGRPEGFTDGKTLIAGRPYPGVIERG